MSEEKKPDPGKRFAEILREGPAVGVHVLAWADTAVAVERTLDRQALREFDHRALYYSEEQGLLETFRPYAVPKGEWLEGVRVRLSAASRPTAPVPSPGTPGEG
jgi:hypothetical protein